MSGQLQSWATNATYSADVAQIAQDLTALRNGLRERQLLALRTECEGFADDVEALYGELPTPDETITDELGASLSSYYVAARDCFDSSSFTSSSFTTYERLLASSTKTYERALGQLAAYGVH